MKLNTIYSYLIIILFTPLIGKLINQIYLYYKMHKKFEAILLWTLIFKK